ncbi:MAG: NADH-quinone oxidoreductase subunit N [bacterium]
MDIKALIPELIFTLVSMFILLLGAFIKGQGGRLLAGIALATLLANLPLMVWLSRQGRLDVLGIFVMDDYAVFLKVLITVVGIVLTFLSMHYLRFNKLQEGEFYSVLLLVVLGAMAVVSSADLTTVFVIFSLISISTYMLIGIARVDISANEASMKYFVLNLFATAVLLLGMSWLYGITGATKFGEISQQLLDRAGLLARSSIPALMLALLLSGFAFKATAVPFHMYAVDVYQGAPTPVAAFLAAGSKVAALAILARMLISGLMPVSGKWAILLWALAVLSLVGGNVTGWVQTNARRLFASASIIHVGYILAGLGLMGWMADPEAREDILARTVFYLVVYAFTITGAFAALSACGRDGKQVQELGDLEGLIRRNPALAVALTLLIASLFGVPVTGGFVGKYYLFTSAAIYGAPWLTALGLLSTFAEAFLYFRVIRAIYSRGEASGEKLAYPRIALISCVVVILAAGVLPWFLLVWARAAVASLFY